MNIRSQIENTVRRYMDRSLLLGTKKQQKQFESITKLQKREWREVLQRIIYAKRLQRTKKSVLLVKARRAALKQSHTSSAEQHLSQFLNSDDVELQAGSGTVMAAAAVACGLAAVGIKKDVAKLASRASGSLDITDSLTTRILARFEEFVETTKKVGGWVFKFAVCLAILWLLNRYGGAAALAGGLIAIAAVYVPEAVTILKQHAGIQQQAETSTSATVLALSSLLLVGSGRTPTYMGDFLKTITQLPRLADGMDFFIEKSIKMVEAFINYVLKRDSSEWISIGDKKSLVDQWRSKCAGVCKVFDTTPKPSRETVMAAQKLVQEGYGFLQVMKGESNRREISIWLDKVNDRLTPHLGTLAAENNFRMMPYCMMFGGKSGVGKTSIVQAVASFTLLLAGSVPASEVLPNLWQKGLSEYWNGYLGQKCIIKDDCFQVKGVAGQHDCEAMEIIRAIGNWACPLNFADVDSKGRYYLDIDLMIGTTNASNIKADWEPFITHPEAVVRRFQGAYWLELNEDYTTPEGRYDYEKIDLIYRTRLMAYAERKKNDPSWKPSVDDALDCFPWDAWIVRTHTYDNSEPLRGPVLTGGLRAAVKMAATAIRERRQAHEKSVASLGTHLKFVEDAMNDISFQAGSELGESSRSVGGLEDLLACPPPHNGEPRVIPWLETSLEFDFTTADPASDVGDWSTPLCEFVMEEELHDKSWVMRLKQALLKWTHSVYAYIGLEIPVAWQGVVDTMALGVSLAVIIGGVKILWGVVSNILKAFGVTSRPTEQSNDKTPETKKPLKALDLPKVKLQLGSPPAEGAHDAVYSNMFLFDLVHKTNPALNQHFGNVLGIGDTVILLPRHFCKKIEQMDNSDQYKVQLTFAVEMDHKVTYETKKFMSLRSMALEGFDLMAIDLTKAGGMRSMRNIVEYFFKADELANIMRGSNIPVRLETIRPDTKGEYIRRTLNAPGVEYVGTVAATGGTLMRGCVKYPMSTMKGDCGSPLMIEENRYGGRCILGLHVAGKTGYFNREGYATIISKDTVRELWLYLTEYKDLGSQELDEILWSGPVHSQLDMQAGLKETGLVGGSVVVLGKLKEPLNVATKTAINPSPLKDEEVFGPCPTAPAVLGSVVRGDAVVHPMARAVEAYQSPVLVGDPSSLSSVVSLAMKRFTQETMRYPRTILPMYETIITPQFWRLKSMNRKTSAGFKYRKRIPDLAKYPGKTYFIGRGDEFPESAPGYKELVADVEHIISEAKKGNRTLHLFTDFLKDELRPLEKVESVKTRMISGAELDYTIAVRMYFGAFQSAMFSTRIKNGMAPGINQYTEWGDLTDKLLSKGGAVFDGDFSRFDASEQPWVHLAILNYINSWYKLSPDWQPEDDVVRGVLWEDLIHSRHVTGIGNKLEYVVQWHKSLPSGHPLTTVVNSMYSLITLTGCYVKLTGDTQDMWEHVFMNTFGDDNVVGVDESVRDIFNQVTVCQVMMSSFGLTYTAGAKDGTLVPYTDIQNITFLKRTFVQDMDMSEHFIPLPNYGWIAPLNLDSVLYTVYWYKSKKDPYGDIAQNAENLLAELALHEEDKWDLYFPKLYKWCSSNNIVLPFFDRMTARAHVKARLDAWF